MASVAAASEGRLKEAGFEKLWVDPKGSMIRVYLPKATAAGRWIELRALCHDVRFRGVVFVSGPRASAEQNVEVLDAIRATPRCSEHRGC
jgi:hypothetical protein